MAKKHIADFLPHINQTDIIKKFFGATVDHLFQTEKSEKFTGYIGGRPNYFLPNTDFYRAETTKSRQDYQLEVGMVTRDQSTQTVTDALTYDDLVNQLRFQGASDANHSRLFEQEFYSWAPPVDLDKLLNYSNYYWYPTGPVALTISGVESELVDVTAILGQASYVSPNGINFSNGMKVKFAGQYVTPSTYRGNEYIVEGVGRAIRLVSVNSLTLPVNYDTDVPDYMVMSRGSVDGNPWSYRNGWYHRDILLQTDALNRKIELSVLDPFDTSPFDSKPFDASLETSSADLVLDPTKQARRPIIEFNVDLELFNYGRKQFDSLTLLDTNTTNIRQIIGSENYIIDGVSLTDGFTILFTKLDDPNINNRVYRVDTTSGRIDLVQVHAPVFDDVVHITAGSFNGFQDFYWNGSAWILAQRKSSVNVAPLFVLYDNDGNRLDDPSIYPNSNFAGSKLFSFKLDTSDGAMTDQVIGLPIAYKTSRQVSDIIYTNHIVADSVVYYINGVQQTIEGFRYHYDITADSYSNDWHATPTISRQFIRDVQFPTVETASFNLPATPDDGESNVVVRVADEFKFQDVDYNLVGNTVVFKAPIIDQVVELNVYSSQPKGEPGHYVVPLNLQANPLTEEIRDISRSDFLRHFVSILKNQDGFIGQPLSANNYKDSARDVSLGTEILQHTSPMVKTMALARDPYLDVIKAINYSRQEYRRYRNKVLRRVEDMTNEGYTTANPPSQWLDDAIEFINVAKSDDFPFHFSRMIPVGNGYIAQTEVAVGGQLRVQVQDPDFIFLSVYVDGVLKVETVDYELSDDGALFVEFNKPLAQSAKVELRSYKEGTFSYLPTTPAALGLAPNTPPYIGTNSIYPSAFGIIECHDGSIYVRTGDIRDEVIFELEARIFNSIPRNIKTDRQRIVDLAATRPGQFRKTAYEYDEYVSFYRPYFLQWATQNSLEYQVNKDFDPLNAWSWNLSGLPTPFGVNTIGNWRGIYKYFFDTDRPHSNPWEMLGFSYKPTWWDAQYGLPPYTAGNGLLWGDLEAGIIRQGPNAGTHPEFARPGLSTMLPVDEAGYLKDPIDARVIINIPTTDQASADWKAGDFSPVENRWITSVDRSYILAILHYLMRPTEFVELGWDVANIGFSTIEPTQLINTKTKKRQGDSSLAMHSEGGLVVYGLSQIVSDYVRSFGRNVDANFGNVIRNAGVQMMHKEGAFVRRETLKFALDASSPNNRTSKTFIPQEDIDVLLYASPSIEEVFYGGVIVEWQGTGYRVFGYDTNKPTFSTLPGFITGRAVTIDIGAGPTVQEYIDASGEVVDVPYGTIFKSRQDVYNFLVSYGRWLESKGWVFDNRSPTSEDVLNWRFSGKEFLFWSTDAWKVGSFIALSPAADSVKFSREFGSIQSVEQVIAGSYSILDRSGSPIDPNVTRVYRDAGSISVRADNNQGMYSCRLYISTYEHLSTFSNITRFNDTIYIPLLNLRQTRLRTSGIHTTEWSGRIDAPGYIVDTENGTLISNPEKMANDFRLFHDIELNTASSEMNSLAKHLIGFQPRDYMDEFRIDEDNQYSLYKGMIHNKGTQTAFTGLFRSNFMAENNGFDLQEEWAVLSGEMGASATVKQLEVHLAEEDIKKNPQMIEFTDGIHLDLSSDSIISILPNDNRVIGTFGASSLPFPSRQGMNADDMPNAGYLRYGDADHMIFEAETLLDPDVYETNNIVDGDTAWVAKDHVVDRGWKSGWNIRKLVPYDFGAVFRDNTTLVTTSNHDFNVGDILVMRKDDAIIPATVQTVVSSTTTKSTDPYKFSDAASDDIILEIDAKDAMLLEQIDITVGQKFDGTVPNVPQIEVYDIKGNFTFTRDLTQGSTTFTLNQVFTENNTVNVKFTPAASKAPQSNSLEIADGETRAFDLPEAFLNSVDTPVSMFKNRVELVDGIDFYVDASSRVANVAHVYKSSPGFVIRDKGDAFYINNIRVDGFVSTSFMDVYNAISLVADPAVFTVSLDAGAQVIILRSPAPLVFTEPTTNTVLDDATHLPATSILADMRFIDASVLPEDGDEIYLDVDTSIYTNLASTGSVVVTFRYKIDNMLIVSTTETPEENVLYGLSLWRSLRYTTVNERDVTTSKSKSNPVVVLGDTLDYGVGSSFTTTFGYVSGNVWTINDTRVRLGTTVSVTGPQIPTLNIPLKRMDIRGQTMMNIPSYTRPNQQFSVVADEVAMPVILTLNVLGRNVNPTLPANFPITFYTTTTPSGRTFQSATPLSIASLVMQLNAQAWPEITFAVEDGKLAIDTVSTEAMLQMNDAAQTTFGFDNLDSTFTPGFTAITGTMLARCLTRDVAGITASVDELNFLNITYRTPITGLTTGLVFQTDSLDTGTFGFPSGAVHNVIDLKAIAAGANETLASLLTVGDAFVVDGNRVKFNVARLPSVHRLGAVSVLFPNDVDPSTPANTPIAITTVDALGISMAIARSIKAFVDGKAVTTLTSNYTTASKMVLIDQRPLSVPGNLNLVQVIDLINASGLALADVAGTTGAYTLRLLKKSAGDTLVVGGENDLGIANGSYARPIPTGVDVAIEADETGASRVAIVSSSGAKLDLSGSSASKMRLNSVAGARSQMGWFKGDRAYIDTVDGAWGIFEYRGPNGNTDQAKDVWVSVRGEESKTDMSTLVSATIHNERERVHNFQLEQYDPYKGIFPATVLKELYYKQDYDPAVYNVANADAVNFDQTNAWGDVSVGRLWFDLNTVRFIDYEQGDLEYRYNNWGGIFPGSSVDIYEWVRSPVPPSQWDVYIQSLEQTFDFSLSGTVRNPTNAAWSEFVEIDAVTGQSKTFYYFWVKNPFTVPQTNFRLVSANEIASIISNPSTANVSWVALASATSVLIGNVVGGVVGDDSRLQLRFDVNESKSLNHVQWELIKENDRIKGVPDEIWRRIHDSMVGFDADNMRVPDDHFPEEMWYGNTIRPRRTWFKDRFAARKIFIDYVNEKLAATNITNIGDFTSILNELNFEDDPSITQTQVTITPVSPLDVGGDGYLFKMNGTNVWLTPDILGDRPLNQPARLSDIVCLPGSTFSVNGYGVTTAGASNVSDVVKAINDITDFTNVTAAPIADKDGFYRIWLTNSSDGVQILNGNIGEMTVVFGVAEGTYKGNRTRFLSANPSVSEGDQIYINDHLIDFDQTTDNIDLILRRMNYFLQSVVSPKILYPSEALTGKTFTVTNNAISYTATFTTDLVSDAVALINQNSLGLTAYLDQNNRVGFKTTSSLTIVASSTSLPVLGLTAGTYKTDDAEYRAHLFQFGTDNYVDIVHHGIRLNSGSLNLPQLGLRDGEFNTATVAKIAKDIAAQTSLTTTTDGIDVSIVDSTGSKLTVDAIEGQLVNVGFLARHYSGTKPVNTVPTRADLTLIRNANVGDRVFVEHDELLRGYWSMWEWDGASFILTQTQTTRVTDYWSYIDWYLDPSFATIIPNRLFNKYTDAISATALYDGEVIKALDDGKLKWVLLRWNTEFWEEVGHQSSAIAFNSRLFDSANFGYDTSDYDTDLFDNDADTEMGIIIDLCKKSILTLQQLNEVFFKLANHAFSEHGDIDWMFKTSIVSLAGVKERVTQSPIFRQDLLSPTIDYFNEIKPYHTKLRDASKTKDFGINNTFVTVTDFDKPPVTIDGVTKRLVVDDPADTQFFGKKPWSDWFDEYQRVNNRVRKTHTTVKFDRVTDYDPEGILNSGANKRVFDSYKPAEDMVRKEDAIKSGFKGTILTGGNLSANVGWDGTPFDFVEWDADEDQIRKLYDLLILGGKAPARVQSITGSRPIIGDGVTTKFALPSGIKLDAQIDVKVGTTFLQERKDYVIDRVGGTIEFVRFEATAFKGVGRPLTDVYLPALSSEAAIIIDGTEVIFPANVVMPLDNGLQSSVVGYLNNAFTISGRPDLTASSVAHGRLSYLVITKNRFSSMSEDISTTNTSGLFVADSLDDSIAITQILGFSLDSNVFPLVEQRVDVIGTLGSTFTVNPNILADGAFRVAIGGRRLVDNVTYQLHGTVLSLEEHLTEVNFDVDVLKDTITDLGVDQRVRFELLTGVIPVGLEENKDYYVFSNVDGVLRLSGSPGNVPVTFAAPAGPLTMRMVYSPLQGQTVMVSSLDTFEMTGIGSTFISHSAGKFLQPYVHGYPEEVMPTKARDSLIMTVTTTGL